MPEVVSIQEVRRGRRPIDVGVDWKAMLNDKDTKPKKDFVTVVIAGADFDAKFTRQNVKSSLERYLRENEIKNVFVGTRGVTDIYYTLEEPAEDSKDAK